MSEQWEKMELGKVCEIILGQSPSSDTYNQDRFGLPFFQGKSEFGSKYAQAKIWCSDPVKIAKMNDILLSVRAPVGESNLAPNICCIGRGLAALRADQEKLLQEFLWYQIDFKKVYLQRISQGSTFDAISGKDLGELEIELPPLPEQKKIAEILSGIDRCIQAKRLRVSKADNIMRAMKEALMTWEEDWQEFELGELLTFRNGLNTEKENFGRGVPFVSYKDVYAGGIVNSKMLKQRVSLSAVEEERFSLQSGDILFTRTSETPEEIGFTCVFDDKHGSAVFNGFCIRGRLLEKGKLMPEFASFYLRSEYVLTQMRFLCKYTTRAGISAESLSQVRVHIPDQETQKRLADSLLAINRYRAAQEEAIKNLKSIKKAVSADLLSGRKRVPL